MSATKTKQPVGDSYRHVRDRFSTAEAAARYPAVYGRGGRHRRERRAILRALQHVPAGAWVLDLPCGTGRGTQLLVEQGYRVTAADASAPMVARARQNYQAFRAGASWAPPVEFAVCDVMATGLPNGRFDAVLCNRLLHHFRESETRRRALRELARVCRGPIVASFFNRFALDTLGAGLRHLVWGLGPSGRLSRQAISMRLFSSDVAAAGLRIEATVAARWGISRQWYVVLDRTGASNEHASGKT